MFYEPLKFRRQFGVERFENYTAAACDGFEFLAHFAATDGGIDEISYNLKKCLRLSH